MKPFLLVDFYKTISFGYLWHLAPAELQKQIQQLLFTDLKTGMADTWMRGKITSEEINIFLANELGEDYERLWKFFVQSSETIGIVDGALALIEQLREKYTTVLITDNMDSLTRFTVPAYKLDDVFDRIVNSADVGIRKSDKNGQIFKLVADDFAGSVLLDDIEGNCVLFNELGGDGRIVTRQNNVVVQLETLL